MGQEHVDQLILLPDAQGAQAAPADVAELGEGDALDRPLPGGEEEVFLPIHLAQGEHGRDALAGLHLQEVDHIGPLGRAAGLGNAVALEPVDFPQAGEKQNGIVGGGGEEGFDKILLPQRLAGHAPAAPALGAVGIDGQALDIPRVGQGVDAVLPLDEILDIQIVLRRGDLGAALVAVFLADLLEFFLNFL